MKRRSWPMTRWAMSLRRQLRQARYERDEALALVEALRSDLAALREFVAVLEPKEAS